MSGIPDDDLQRNLVVADAESPKQTHIGLAGNSYTILLTGKDTAGRFCLIDMHVPPGGGPPLHRHDFEESFTVLEGEIEATFRGAQSTVATGQTINIPANAPHQFRNQSQQTARLLCICSPAGQEEFFLEVGTQVSSRTALPPPLDQDAQAKLRAKSAALALKYKTEFLK
jgi:quercetin dioxygenase-like cupin family protein